MTALAIAEFLTPRVLGWRLNGRDCTVLSPHSVAVFSRLYQFFGLSCVVGIEVVPETEVRHHLSVVDDWGRRCQNPVDPPVRKGRVGPIVPKYMLPAEPPGSGGSAGMTGLPSTRRESRARRCSLIVMPPISLGVSPALARFTAATQSPASDQGGFLDDLGANGKPSVERRRHRCDVRGRSGRRHDHWTVACWRIMPLYGTIEQEVAARQR